MCVCGVMWCVCVCVCVCVWVCGCPILSSGSNSSNSSSPLRARDVIPLRAVTSHIDSNRHTQKLPSVLQIHLFHSMIIQVVSYILTNLDLQNSTLGYGFHFQHRNSRTFPIENLSHYSERTLIYSEYGYPKGSPNTNS
jgi:hypothetical protein